MGPIFLRCTKILSQNHLFLSFLHNPFLPCDVTFMDDYMMEPIGMGKYWRHYVCLHYLHNMIIDDKYDCNL
jgi:hypothetical protein